jgi:hypothetical protein
MSTTADAGAEIDAIVVRLSHRLGIAEGVVRDCVEDAAARFSNARIRSFVPLLIEREAGRVLRALSSAWDDVPGTPRKAS